MQTTLYTIDDDNNISALAELPADAIRAEAFASEKELARLTADWPASRLLDMWNSFAGVAPFDKLKPVKKFTDRKSAVGRLWKAVQRLTPAAAPQVPTVATAEAEAKKSPRTRAAASTARDGSKQAEVIAMLRRPNGASLDEIVNATGWQAHTVRGFISGTVGKKLGLTVQSSRGEDKSRIYRLSS